jgi:uncharacterized protein YbbC (DUF1343 family)
LCCNPTAVDHEYRHAIDLLLGSGWKVERLFGPEHGVRATAQDMEHVHEHRDPVTGIPTVSLYGSTAASLRPPASAVEDLDVVLFDIQDIGARFYTYQATLGFLMEVAGRVGTRVVVLDRPNPITGVHVEGNVVRPGYESFVGAYPLCVRHGMTVGELAGFFQRYCGVSCEVEVVRCEGWQRHLWMDQTDMPWVYPSPNMPTLDTATVYPGMCLIEGTNVSEGRGTTRPFHLVGAPWLDPQRLAAACEQGAARSGLRGVRFRPAAFIPGFQKHARVSCGGVEIHVVDRNVVNTFLLGLVVTWACRSVAPDHFQWRTETYEFVDDPIAIDLLIGNPEYRIAVDAGGPVDFGAMLKSWELERAAFLERRSSCLLYG